MKPTQKQFGYWYEETNGNEPLGYWCLYDSLEDAVIEAKGKQLYQFDAKLLGVYTVKVERKVKIRKKRSKK